MKYAHKREEKFVTSGAFLSFMIGLIHSLIAIACEAISIYIIVSLSEVEEIIDYFIALKVVVLLPEIYREACCKELSEIVMEEAKLKYNEDHEADKKMKFTKQMWKTKGCKYRVARTVYRLLRGFYVSVVFYFVPFSVIFLNFWSTV